ncbi:hypothetical protein K469DRAFT_78196 [Zopfia rhizophila CBS 207.26]|uniref:Uncharacterized protein n=1 Tax=Zopfia rhizophila CBS 207.26 TaxID=1314779 RepID=A0A6A6DAA3_9PEZI|nr:hypothetical protein K469DRAFT_78196 [Zopfia rhizophila CBS 207.26]
MGIGAISADIMLQRHAVRVVERSSDSTEAGNGHPRRENATASVHSSLKQTGEDGRNGQAVRASPAAQLEIRNTSQSLEALEKRGTKRPGPVNRPNTKRPRSAALQLCSISGTEDCGNEPTVRRIQGEIPVDHGREDAQHDLHGRIEGDCAEPLLNQEGNETVPRAPAEQTLVQGEKCGRKGHSDSTLRPSADQIPPQTNSVQASTMHLGLDNHFEHDQHLLCSTTTAQNGSDFGENQICMPQQMNQVPHTQEGYGLSSSANNGTNDFSGSLAVHGEYSDGDRGGGQAVQSADCGNVHLATQSYGSSNSLDRRIGNMPRGVFEQSEGVQSIPRSNSDPNTQIPSNNQSPFHHYDWSASMLVSPPNAPPLPEFHQGWSANMLVSPPNAPPLPQFQQGWPADMLVSPPNAPPLPGFRQGWPASILVRPPDPPLLIQD